MTIEITDISQPLQIIVSVPEGFRDYVRPVIWAEASTVGMAQPDCKSETEVSGNSAGLCWLINILII